MHLYHHLTSDMRYDREKDIMVGEVRFVAECEPQDSQRFWSQATLSDMGANAKNDRDWFALSSSCTQLQRVKNLAFCPKTVGANTATFALDLNKLDKPDDDWQPRQVFLFSGHMIDAPDRPTPRFPADKELSVAQKIRAALEALGAGPDDLALAQGASGGDILFLEACHERGLRLQLLLPLAEPEFIERSILPSAGGAKWRDRYYTLKAGMKNAPRVMPDELGSLPKDMDPFERCNLLLLHTALAYGVDKVRFICLWDGGGGDGPGGTERMYNEVKRRTGRVTWIDSRQL